MSKPERYNRIHLQLQDLLAKSPNSFAAMATTSAVLLHKFPYYSWCGFYYLQNGELVVGPYQGPVACQILGKHKGVCWAAIDSANSQMVPDVEKFPGHIACDSRTKSEVVIPLRNAEGIVVAVLDVDSHSPNSFDDDDKAGLEKIAQLLEPISI